MNVDEERRASPFRPRPPGDRKGHREARTQTEKRERATPLGILMAAGVLVLTFVGLAVWAGNWAFDSAFGEDYERFRSIQAGTSEQAVRKALGEPHKIFYRETARSDYYVPGYSHKRRPITSKVFVYIATEPIAYIYFDEDDQVEEVFVGGS